MITPITPYTTRNHNHFGNKIPNINLTTINRGEFSYETLTKLANKWARLGILEEGDSLIAIPKGQLRKAAKIDKKIEQFLNQTRISNNGFAVCIIKWDGQINTKAIDFFDPKVNTILQLVHQIKNNRVYIQNLRAEYIE